MFHNLHSRLNNGYDKDNFPLSSDLFHWPIGFDLGISSEILRGLPFSPLNTDNHFSDTACHMWHVKLFHTGKQCNLYLSCYPWYIFSHFSCSILSFGKQPSLISSIAKCRTYSNSQYAGQFVAESTP